MSFATSLKRAVIGGVQLNSVNRYNENVFQYLNNGSVIWMNDKPLDYINNGYYLNPDVYAAVQTIVNIASVAPLNLYQVKPDNEAKKAYKKYKALCKGIPDSENLKQRAFFKTKALEEVDSHKILDRLNKPNEWQTINEFLANVYGFRLVTGNAYIYKSKSQVGTPEVMKLYVMPSQEINIESGGVMNPVSKYIYGINSKNEQKIEPEDMIHNRSWSLDYSYAGSHLFGISPLKAARRSITMSNDGREAQTSMLKNMGSKGLLAFDAVASGLKTGGLTVEQAQTMKDEFNANNRGIDKAGRVNVINGKFEWHQMGMSAVDMSIIESQKWSQADICKCFGISPIVLGDMSNSTDNNYKHARVSAITNAVIPLLLSVRDSLNNGFVSEFDKTGGYVLDYDLSVFSELQEDMASMVAYLKDAWWLRGNEKREQMTYGVDNDDPNMNKYYIPTSLMPLDEMNAPKDLGNLPLTGDYSTQE